MDLHYGPRDLRTNRRVVKNQVPAYSGTNLHIRSTLRDVNGGGRLDRVVSVGFSGHNTHELDDPGLRRVAPGHAPSRRRPAPGRS